MDPDHTGHRPMSTRGRHLSQLPSFGFLAELLSQRLAFALNLMPLVHNAIENRIA